MILDISNARKRYSEQYGVPVYDVELTISVPVLKQVLDEYGAEGAADQLYRAVILKLRALEGGEVS